MILAVKASASKHKEALELKRQKCEKKAAMAKIEELKVKKEILQAEEKTDIFQVHKFKLNKNDYNKV